MSPESSFSIAFVLSLMGGILILMSGFVSSVWFMMGGSNFWGMMGGGMMDGWGRMMGGYGFPFGFMGWFSIVTLVAGILVIIGAIMLNARPVEHLTWGIIILIFSIVSFIGMGGFVLGGLLGIAGGALALSYRSPTKT